MTKQERLAQAKLTIRIKVIGILILIVMVWGLRLYWKRLDVDSWGI